MSGGSPSGRGRRPRTVVALRPSENSTPKRISSGGSSLAPSLEPLPHHRVHRVERLAGRVLPSDRDPPADSVRVRNEIDHRDCEVVALREQEPRRHGYAELVPGRPHPFGPRRSLPRLGRWWGRLEEAHSCKTTIDPGPEQGAPRGDRTGDLR